MSPSYRSSQISATAASQAYENARLYLVERASILDERVDGGPKANFEFIADQVVVKLGIKSGRLHEDFCESEINAHITSFVEEVARGNADDVVISDMSLKPDDEGDLLLEIFLDGLERYLVQKHGLVDRDTFDDSHDGFGTEMSSSKMIDRYSWIFNNFSMYFERTSNKVKCRWINSQFFVNFADIP